MTLHIDIIIFDEKFIMLILKNNNRRAFSEMKKLFTPFYWIVFICVIFTICVSIIL